MTGDGASPVRYRLVVVDLDGTARSRVHGITPGVQNAVAAARARGVRVCVATGQMATTRTPCGATSRASALVRVITAPFDAAYT